MARPSSALLGILLLLLTPACVPHDGYVPEGWLLLRQQQYLDHATEEWSPGNVLNVIAHLEKERRDPRYHVPAGSIPDDAWDPLFQQMYELRDTADFRAMYFLNLLYGYRGHPAASPALWQRVEDALLDFKYGMSDPTPARLDSNGDPVVDRMWRWTENHVLIFHMAEYLAGQRFPDEVFSVTGLTGAQHMARARPVLLRWLDERSRWGFSEWHSDVYANLSQLPLLTLVEWAEDPVIARRAAMVLDLLWLDVALNLQNGMFGATHGRSYIKDKAAADLEDTFNATKLFFDDTVLPYRGRGSSSGTLHARARKYRLPEVIRRIARSAEPHWDRQRQSLPLPEEAPPHYDDPLPPPPYGLTYTEADLDTWWMMGSQSVWPVLPLTLEVAERENLWEGALAPFKPLRDIVWVDGDFDMTLFRAHFVYRSLWKAFNQALLKQVNTVTFRTDDYMLSSAQDYRKGLRGQQTHTWQATFDEKAFVFTNHPADIWVTPGDPVPPDWDWGRVDDDGPTYWTGEASQPRTGQYRNVSISIYAPQYPPRPGGQAEFDYRDETHAYFPHAHFDEVVQEGPWTFGRRGDGYLALYSYRPTVWRSGQPDVHENAGLPFDLVAEGGAQNVWIAECGAASQWGSFAAFRAAVAAADVVVTPVADQGGDGMGDGFDVAYDSPSLGPITFGWYAPLVVDGDAIPLADYPRFDNPYVQAAFDEAHYEISDGAYGLELDFDTDLRAASAPADVGRTALERLALIWQALVDALQHR